LERRVRRGSGGFSERFVVELAKEKDTTPAEFEKEFFKSVRPTSLLKRFLLPEEVAKVVVFVCSPEAAAISGAAVRADSWPNKPPKRTMMARMTS
jgi:NAD(P)-dependent dehydrogenase (short-subunit alcohol dehydrogenase family)